MIKNVSVIGAGTMGHGIAHVFARHGCNVSLYDAFEPCLKDAPKKMREELQFMADEDYISQEDVEDTLSRITTYSDLAEAVKEAEYVIEAIPEKMELKKELFGKLDKLCPEHTIFASNTSSLKLSEMISDLPEERKCRCMISHWYNPAYLLPIAELSQFGNMPEDIFEEVYELYVRSGKKPVRVKKDITGMIANRLLHAQAREAFHLVEIGAGSPEDIDNALKFGPCFRNATTGMLEVADMGGLDVWLAGEDNIFPALDNSTEACHAMRELVDEGNLGLKTGEGFFKYSEEKRDEAQKEFYHRLITQLKASANY